MDKLMDLDLREGITMGEAIDIVRGCCLHYGAPMTLLALIDIGIARPLAIALVERACR